MTAGPYRPAVRHGDLLFCSGQIALDPASGEMVRGLGRGDAPLHGEPRRRLREHGTDLSRALRLTIYTTQMGNFAELNEVYASFFAGRPAGAGRGRRDVAAARRRGDGRRRRCDRLTGTFAGSPRVYRGDEIDPPCIAAAFAAVALFAGCDTDTQVTGERADAKTRPPGVIAFGARTAGCEEAIPGSLRVGGSDPRRRFTRAGPFGLLREPRRARARPARGVSTGPRPAPAAAHEDSGDRGRRRSGDRLNPRRRPRSGWARLRIPAGVRASLGPGDVRAVQAGRRDILARWPRAEGAGAGDASDHGGGRQRRSGACGSATPRGSTEPVAVGTHVARCRQAMIGDMRIERRRYTT